MLLAAVACYFAIDASRAARGAAFAAEWGSSSAADELSEMSQTLDKIAKDTELMSADARVKAEVDRIMRGY
jgi:tRNA nucleotidyltransferase/poly(A) polymerase